MNPDDDQPQVSNPEEDREPLGAGEAERLELPEALPVLPLRGAVIYPHIVLPLAVSTEQDTKLVNDVVVGNRLMAAVAAKDPEVENPGPDDLYDVGCAVVVLKLMRFPDKTTRILAQGLSRIRIESFTKDEPYLMGRVSRLESRLDDSVEVQAQAKSATEMFQQLVDLSNHLPEELKLAVLNIDDMSRLADVISSTLNLNVAQRQEILEMLDVAKRFRLVNRYLSQELSTAELSSKIQTQVRSELDRDQREFILRRQLKAIREELGETTEQGAEAEDLRERIEGLKLPEEVQREVDRELDRLGRMPPQASEYHVARTYLEWILALPWNKRTQDKMDIEAAAKILDKDHYDLDKVKERILEYLAVRKLKNELRGPILCFVGPPGTGKTSLGRSIARALGRKFVRISLGGVLDEAEIRGHRRTYVGALPGRIIQGLRKADSSNPVFMLDEVDKLYAGFQGDPAAALLEVLDPEQNFSFNDHYLNVPFDLSDVMFICTANMLDPIAPALLDRMEVLTLPGYTIEEKVHIARRYLVPRQVEENGLKRSDLRFPPAVIRRIINDYTREAGLRNLERNIGTICRKYAAEVARKETRPKGRRLKASEVPEFLGQRKFTFETAARTADPGVATGLAWTPSGGQILFIESTRYAGRGRLLLTGKLGDVMKESARAALSYIRSRAEKLRINMEEFEKSDLHIHVPAGAIPKDGPSAGVTVAVSLISLFTNEPVRSDVAMSGEITLRGHVLPVGGIKEKILAARQAGIKTIVLPQENEKDLADVPEAARKGVEFIFARTIDDILPVAFDGTPRKTKNKKKRAGQARRRKSSSGKKTGRSA